MTSPASRTDRAFATLLRPFAPVEPIEAITASELTLTVFLLLTAYYLLNTAREPLILLHGGAELKLDAAAGRAILLLVFVQNCLPERCAAQGSNAAHPRRMGCPHSRNALRPLVTK